MGNVDFELTYLCNLKCLHCYNPTHSKIDELSTMQIKEIVREVKDAGFKEIHFNGGEPLLRKDIFAILEYSTKIGLKTILETNATLLFQPELLVGMGNISIRASIDGSESTHNRIRITNNQNINAFRESMANLSNAQNLGIPVQVTCSVNKINLNSIYQMVEEVVGYGIENIRLRLTMPTGFAIGNWSELGGMNEKDIEVLEKVSNKIKVDLPNINFAYTSINRQSPNFEPKFFIDPNGRVKPYPFIEAFAGDLKIQKVNQILENILEFKLPLEHEKRMSDYLIQIGMVKRND